MLDPRYTKLANTLINYSCRLQPGENVLIEAIDIPHEFTKELIRVTTQTGGRPLILLKSNEIERALRMNATREQFELIAHSEMQLMKRTDCYLGIRGNFNISEASDVPTPSQNIYESTIWNRVHRDIRVPKTRWCVLRWPTPSMAQMAEMSTEAFEDFFFDVCTLDYAKMSRAMQPLKTLMQQTDRVRIKGPQGTDLIFSIKNIPTRTCSGLRNIPDGEIFTAPVRESVNGTIHYNCPSLYRGTTHTDVRFTFKNGKIIHATSNNTHHLNEILNTDEGARYIGEFAIGVNPYCTKPMKDTLFDEKIAGSIHFTPGASYGEASNGNHSTIHWDLVLQQTPEAGGGQIFFDNKLIRDDGRFVPKELQPLNPENLK
ncbi:MAG: aminopeptidase [Phycisphaerales bacterium]|nr:aminopeptidase [Phycisphaerales bacterium]